MKKQRGVISNVRPSIPNNILLDALKFKGILPVSQIRDIRAGLTKSGRSHILSFRRQVYIKQEEEPLLPDSLQINHDNTDYWVYFGTDSTCCFICKKIGHIAKLCPQIKPSNSPIEMVTETNTEITPITSAIPNEQTNHDTEDNRKKSTKRPSPSSTTSGSDIKVNISSQDDSSPDPKNTRKENDGFIKPKPKKAKKLKLKTRTQVRTHAHTHIHTHIHTHAPTHIHTRSESPTKTQSYSVINWSKSLIKDQSNNFPLDYNTLKTFL